MPILRWLAIDIVAEAGFKGLEASSTDEAILHLETRTENQITFTGSEMPGSMDDAN